MTPEALTIAAAAVRLYAESHPRPIHVTKTDAAKMLGISRPTVDTLIKAGTLSLNGNEPSGLARVSAGRGEFLGSGELLPIRSQPATQPPTPVAPPRKPPHNPRSSARSPAS